MEHYAKAFPWNAYGSDKVGRYGILALPYFTNDISRIVYFSF
jgi:hypothetical protein